jgi:hypothetical protein
MTTLIWIIIGFVSGSLPFSVWVGRLALGWLDNSLPDWPLWPLILIGLGVGVRMLTAAVTRQRLTDALLMPVSTLLMTRIALQVIWWRWRYGGPRWKGRTIGK